MTIEKLLLYPVFFYSRDILNRGIDTAILKQNNPYAVHMMMFLPALMGQGTPEQIEKWVTLAYNNAIMGTYAQVI